jgi:aspartyl-tRNA(Asn)/glutamyl-tRNA(Gln) amidotransferase subunit B
VRLTRIHIEEDAGKNVHVAGEDVSLLDYNRAGAPLLEIVGEPDLRSSQQAADYLRELRSIVRALGISEANMEEGTLRCDANVSLRPRGSPELGTRCEIKNLNSFRFLAQAIEAEIRRQTDILDGGGRVQMATLSYDPERDRTRVMRTKEEAADYRYMPEPDLPPLRIDAATIEAIAAELPPLPAARRQRWHAQGVSADDARLLSDEPALARYFDAVLEAGAGATDAANWVTGDLLGKLNAEGHAIDDVRVDPGTLAEILALVGDGTVSRAAGKRVLLHVYDRGGTAAEAVETLGLRQLSDPGALEAVVREILDASPNQLAQYRAGKTNLRGYFVGQVMKKTGGKANPKVVVELLDRLLISEP